VCGCVGVAFVIGTLHDPFFDLLLTSDSITQTVSSLTTHHHHHHLPHTTHALQFKDVAKLDEAAIDAVINGGGEAKQ